MIWTWTPLIVPTGKWSYTKVVLEFIKQGNIKLVILPHQNPYINPTTSQSMWLTKYVDQRKSAIDSNLYDKWSYVYNQKNIKSLNSMPLVIMIIVCKDQNAPPLYLWV